MKLIIDAKRKKQIKRKLEVEKQMAAYHEIKPKYPVTKITNYIQIIGGGTPSTKEMTYWNGNIPWLSVVDFNNEYRFVSETQRKLLRRFK